MGGPTTFLNKSEMTYGGHIEFGKMLTLSVTNLIVLY